MTEGWRREGRGPCSSPGGYEAVEMDGCGRTDGWMDGWMDGWIVVDGWGRLEGETPGPGASKHH